MNIRIGIVGPADSVQQIMSVAQEFENVAFTPFIYEDVYQVEHLILSNNKPIDQWFFSGILNYNYAIKKNLVTESQATHPPLYGSSFFGTLIEAQLDANTVFKKISMDTIPETEIKKALSFYQLESLEYTSFPFNDYTYIHKLADFHEKVYKDGDSDVAITSASHAYHKLKERGIPVYRITPSYLSIRLSLQLLVERAQADRFKKSQIAIIGCQVDYLLKQKDETFYTFRMKHKELDIIKSLLTLAEKINGSYVRLGDGLFFIYATRGEINHSTENYIFQLSKALNDTDQWKVKFSIGFGENASQAEQHVQIGFKQKLDVHDHSIIMIDENLAITSKGGSDADDDFQFQTTSIGEEWERKIRKSGISVKVVSKLVSLTKHYNRTEFSSQDLSLWLKCSERNARRILLNLEKSKVIEQCGENQSETRGRPRKLYCFINDQD
jgi:hypothetical protein